MKKTILLFTLLVSAISFAQNEERGDAQLTMERTETVDQVVIDYDHDIFYASKVEIKPEFPGGDAAIYDYLKKKMQISKEESEKEGTQKIYVSFVIEKNGRLSDIKILRSGSSPELNEKLIKAIKSMPKWKPGKQNNREVRCSYSLAFKP